MKGFAWSLLGIALLFSSGFAYAVDLGEVVVTGTYSEMAVKESGTTIEVIDADEIETKGYNNLAQALKVVRGIDISSNGITGTTSVYFRGLDNKYTKIMVDGVCVYNASSLHRDFDINGFDLSNVERIEVAKGIQSSVYGTDAIGGVINIITKKGTESTQVDINTEFGSHDTFRESVGVRGSVSDLRYSVNASRMDTDGISAVAKHNHNSVAENDGAQRTAFSTRLDYAITDSIDMAVYARYNKNDYEYDRSSGGVLYDDITLANKEKISSFGTEFKQIVNEVWKYDFSFSTVNYQRRSKPYDSIYKGRVDTYAMKHSLELTEFYTLLGGIQYDREKFYSTYDRQQGDNRAYFLENKFSFLDKKLNSVLSLRADDNSRFGTHRTFKLDTSYLFETGTRLKFNWGTGFKAPSLAQIYNTYYGNKDLTPEKLHGFEFGVEQELLDGDLEIGTTYFHNNIKNRIDYLPTGMWSGYYENMEGRTTTEGVELFADYQITDDLNVALDYTYTEAKNSNGIALARRARNKYGLSLDYRFLEKGTVSFDIARYVGRRGYSVTYLKNYTKADLALSYDVTENLNVYARIENLFDETYYLAYGYSTEGRSLYSGLRLKF